MNGVLPTMISEGKIKFILATVITTNVKLFKGHIRDKTCQIFGENKGQVMSQFHGVPYKTRFGPHGTW